MSNEEAAACACIVVRYNPRDNGDGTLSSRWSCDLCGREFIPKSESWIMRMAKAEVGAGFIGAGDTPYNRLVHAITASRKPMTMEEALVEARHRWGVRGSVYDRNSAPHIEWLSPRFWVGDRPEQADFGGVWTYGNGATWEEAFADADKRGEK